MRVQRGAKAGIKTCREALQLLIVRARPVP